MKFEDVASYEDLFSPEEWDIGQLDAALPASGVSPDEASRKGRASFITSMILAATGTTPRSVSDANRSENIGAQF